MAMPAKGKRARTADEKEARRDSILEAAQGMIENIGIDDFTMNALSAETGLSKGTLYLYFRTKEELLLSLYMKAMEQVVARIETEVDSDTLIEVMGKAPAEVPLFMPLLARLVTVIEVNVPDEPLFAEKRRMRDMVLRIAAVIARVTGAPDERAEESSMALMLCMQGAAHFDIAANRKLSSVPEDLLPLYQGQSFAISFPVAARLILSGLARS